MEDLTENPFPRAIAWIGLVLALALAVLVLAGCQEKDGGSNPFAPCPAGWHRMRDVTQSPGRQWVCEK